MKRFEELTSVEQQKATREILNEFSILSVTMLIQELLESDFDRYSEFLHTSEMMEKMRTARNEAEKAGNYDDDAIYDYEGFEPMQWFRVDSYFAAWLEGEDAVVCNMGGETYWARGGCGQWIGLDSDVKNICAEIFNKRLELETRIRG